MSDKLRILIFLLLQTVVLPAICADTADSIDQLEKPLYSPFIERYILDEIKQLRIDLAAHKVEMTQQIVDREIASIDRGVTYATDTVTYFFYLIAAASSILVVVGLSSFRDIKERVHNLADEEIAKLVREYEHRLEKIELQMKEKTRHIEDNREEIELTQEIQSLWLRAGRENNNVSKIAIYDQILKIRQDDVEALTYKADAVLELGEPQWAVNLCQQALSIDPDCSHAFYQLACAYTAMEQFDDAFYYLCEAISRSELAKEDILADPALTPLKSLDSFNEIINTLDGQRQSHS